MPFPFKRDASYAATIRVLSVKQPWAWATIHAGRDVDCRRWRTPYRGPVFIHASARTSQADYDAFLAFISARKLIDPAIVPALQDLPLGGLIGRATLVDCTGRGRSRWFTGYFGLYLAGPEPIPFRRCKGGRSLFTTRIFPDLIVQLIAH